MKILVPLLSAMALHGSSPSLVGAQERVQPQRWLAQVAPFVIQYHRDFGYATGAGAQLAVGCRLHASIDGVMKFSYSRPSQNFLWLGETQSLKTDWYRWQFALRLRWAPSHSHRFHLFAEMQGGWVYLNPHALALDGGTLGTIIIEPNDEIKFAPALSGGFSYNLARGVAAYLQLELGCLQQANRRLNETAPAPAWKSHRQLSAGAMLRF